MSILGRKDKTKDIGSIPLSLESLEAHIKLLLQQKAGGPIYNGILVLQSATKHCLAAAIQRSFVLESPRTLVQYPNQQYNSLLILG
eukprot:1137601-Pelagomonas_calceolata.AAC.4